MAPMLIAALFLILCGRSKGYHALVNPSPLSFRREPSIRTATSIKSYASGSNLEVAEPASDEDAVDAKAPNSQCNAVSNRRRAVIKLAGALSATPAVLAAHADPSPISAIQGPVQDIIAPGHWIGQFVGINSKTETWEFPSSTAAEVSSALVEVLNELTPERRAKLLMPNFKIQRSDANRVHVMTWTKAEWLDSLDVKLTERTSLGVGGKGCVVTATFYATGFLPTSIPLAPLVNVAFAWFPFASPGPRGEMLQDFRLRAIRGLIDKRLQAA